MTFCNPTTGLLVCYTAVFRVVTQCSSPLCGEERDDTKNSCVADYWFPCKMTSDDQTKNFHSDNGSLPRCGGHYLEAGGLFEMGRLTCNRGFTVCTLYSFYCSFRMLKLIHQVLTQRYASNFFFSQFKH